MIESADRVIAGLATPAAADMPDIMGFGLPARAEIAVLGSKGRALLYDGDRIGARESLARALDCDGMSFPPFAVHAVGTAALLEAATGHLERGEELARRALEIAREANLVAHPAPADALLALGRVALARADTQQASHLLEEAAARASQNRRSTLVAQIRGESALLAMASGDPVDGLRRLAAPAGEPPVPIGLSARLTAIRGRLLIATADLARARAVLEASTGPTTADLHAAFVALAVAEQDTPAARKALDAVDDRR